MTLAGYEAVWRIYESVNRAIFAYDNGLSHTPHQVIILDNAVSLFRCNWILEASASEN